MPVMDVGVMRVGMSQPRVSVPMGMRFARRIAWRVLVLVVLVVVVEMFVFQRLMDVLVFVSLGDVQPDAEEHENARSAERPIEAALSDCEGERGACKRGGGEIGSCASRAKMTERPNEKNEAYAVTEKTDGRHGEDNAHGRQFRAGGKREAGIYGASGETLPHGDLVKLQQRYQNSHRIVRNPLFLHNLRRFFGSRNCRLFTRPFLGALIPSVSCKQSSEESYSDVVGFELDHDRARVVSRSIPEWQGILLGHQVSLSSRPSLP
jgi:hypothetical protein